MQRRKPIIAPSAFVALVLIGCGASSAPERNAQSPERSRAASKASAEDVRSEHEIAHAEQDTERATEAPPIGNEPAESEQAALHSLERPSALRVLTSPGVTFMTDYLQSAAYATAVKDCEALAGDDEGKRGKCLARARDQFSADGMSFRRDDDGNLWWVVFKRQGEELTLIHKSRVEVVSEGPTNLTLAIRGPEEGRRTLFRGVSRIVLDVPDEYSIHLEDANFGRLTYDAKFGFQSR